MTEASTTTHKDPARPTFGYDGGDPFFRAVDAKQRAEWRAEHAAERIAETVLADCTPEAYDVTRYAKTKAGRAYAEAVYEVEAAKVRVA